MYATNASHNDVPDDFSAIKVEMIANRTGQQLRNHLLDLLTPRGQPAKARYLLKVTLQERNREVALDPTGLATRTNVTVSARYALVNAATGELLTTGSARAFSSYNLTESEFSNLTAENDTVARATELIATDIRARLAAYFVERSPV